MPCGLVLALLPQSPPPLQITQSLAGSVLSCLGQAHGLLSGLDGLGKIAHRDGIAGQAHGHLCPSLCCRLAIVDECIGQCLQVLQIPALGFTRALHVVCPLAGQQEVIARDKIPFRDELDGPAQIGDCVCVGKLGRRTFPCPPQVRDRPLHLARTFPVVSQQPGLSFSPSRGAAL